MGECQVGKEFRRRLVEMFTRDKLMTVSRCQTHKFPSECPMSEQLGTVPFRSPKLISPSQTVPFHRESTQLWRKIIAIVPISVCVDCVREVFSDQRRTCTPVANHPVGLNLRQQELY